MFKSKEEMYGIFTPVLEKGFGMEEVANKLHDTGIAMRFNYTEPAGCLVIDCARLPVKWGFDLEYGKVDVDFTLSGETAHKFFLGRLNVPTAIATRKIIFKGSVSKSLKLLPAMKSLYRLYRESLKEMGREDLLAEEETKRPAPARRRGGLRDLFSRRAMVDYDAARRLYRIGTAPPAGETVPAGKRKTGSPQESPELCRKMLEKMVLIRKFEEHLAGAFAAGKLPTFAVHLSIGQEAVAAGACLALGEGDIINTTHRGHGHLLAKGTDLDAMMAELYGKATGTCGGKGGSMHVIDRSIGIMGSNGIVGAGVVLGAGAALASSVLADGRVSVVFFGDGATNQGMFHEGLNFAAVKKLPAVFIIENNMYGEFTPLAEHAGNPELWKRADSYGIEGVRIDGNDARAVFRTVSKAAEKARAGGGPTLIECVTYRWHGHMEGDSEEYRLAGEKVEWMKKCPIDRLRRELEGEGLLSDGEFERIVEETEKLVAGSVAAALDAPLPDADSLYADVYAPDVPECYSGGVELKETVTEMTVSQAINETIAAEMRMDSSVILMGEDVTLGGYFSLTAGLVEEFGRERVIDTPISEYAIVGGGVGAAAEGLRPIVEILFTDFITTCLDPIVNQAAKLHYMSGGQVSVPLVIRMPSGGGIGMAAQHSQSLETLLVGIPGLTVVAPSDAHTAAGLMRSAVRSNNPVIFVEHKLLYLEVGPVGGDDVMVPLRRSRVAREGSDVTLVSYSYGVRRCMEAAGRLKNYGVNAEIVDLLTLYPLNIEPVFRSIEKTRRLVVVEEGTLTLGIGAEVLARVAECAWGVLKTPPRRLAGREVPAPYSPALEQLVTPTAEEICDQVMEIL
ncbi:MAG: pyruvate dehydrogenase complex E1 component subunit beta [bacterium]